MDAIAGWGSFSNEQKQGALEDAAKRKEEHERLYSRATRLVNTATSTAASLVSKMEQRPPPQKKQTRKEASCGERSVYQDRFRTDARKLWN